MLSTNWGSYRMPHSVIRLGEHIPHNWESNYPAIMKTEHLLCITYMEHLWAIHILYRTCIIMLKICP